jgi:transcriptional regulator GlxA family with amidase domain
MAGFIAGHAAEPIGVAEVAAAVNLHPRYAMTVFKDSLGISIGRYLTQCRVAEAQRLLISTDHAVADIGFLSGFSSQSRFYAAFRDICRSAPAAYRRAHQR